MYRSRILASVLLLVALSLAGVAQSALIDFEQTPAATTPIDDSQLTTPYSIPGGNVSFFFDNNANNTFDAGVDDYPVFEHIGTDGNDGFQNGGLGVQDTATPPFGPQLGSFFLRGPVGFAVPRPFIVDYNTGITITALSGEIWDIDGASQATELWNVEVLDNANNVLASQLSPLGNSSALDGKPWVFAFTGLPLGVDKIRITFLGTKTMGVGLAFNNFSPTEAVPEPASIVIMGLGGAGLLAIRLRRRSGRQF
jgi:PEP-CTERM motif